MVRRALSEPRPQAGARARGGAHGGPHHLSVRGGIAPQIRAQPAGSPRGHLRFRRRFPGRELSAPPGQHFRRPLRRELLPLYHPRDGLFRSGGGARRNAGRRVRGHTLAFLHHLIHQRLAVSDPGKPADRARAERGGSQCQLCRDRHRYRARRVSAARAGAVRNLARFSERLRRAPRPRPLQVMAASGEGAALSFGAAAQAMMAPGAAGELRQDLRLIAEMIEPGSRVLDIGCGDGSLLAYLARQKSVDGRGIELSQSGVNACVGHGLSVIQGDADRDLEAYPAGAFDVVVLSQTLQATHRPRRVVEELVRIGRRAIVSFPNFGFWRIRLRLLLTGRMPVSHCLAYPWHETPNIHLCTIRDFVALCDEIGVRVDRSVTLDRQGQPYSLDPRGSLANLLAEQGIFVLCGSGGP